MILNYHLYMLDEFGEIVKHLGEYRRLAQVEESIRRNSLHEKGKLRLVNPRKTSNRDLVSVEESGKIIWDTYDI